MVVYQYQTGPVGRGIVQLQAVANKLVVELSDGQTHRFSSNLTGATGQTGSYVPGRDGVGISYVSGPTTGCIYQAHLTDGTVTDIAPTYSRLNTLTASSIPPAPTGGDNVYFLSFRDGAMTWVPMGPPTEYLWG